MEEGVWRERTNGGAGRTSPKNAVVRRGALLQASRSRLDSQSGSGTRVERMNRNGRARGSMREPGRTGRSRRKKRKRAWLRFASRHWIVPLRGFLPTAVVADAVAVTVMAHGNVSAA